MSQTYYHGSNHKIEVLRPGSYLTNKPEDARGWGDYLYAVEVEPDEEIWGTSPKVNQVHYQGIKKGDCTLLTKHYDEDLYECKTHKPLKVRDITEEYDRGKRATRLAERLVADRSEPGGLEELITRLKESNPGLKLGAYETDHKIELDTIKVENKGQGIGTRVIREIQDYARQVGKPIVLRPSWDPRKKDALLRFYKSLGFVINKGRQQDYTLSSPFALTMYWKP